MCQTTLTLKVTHFRVSVCLVSKNMGKTKTDMARSMECSCAGVCVFGVSVLAAYRSVPRPEILHLASINRSVLFISRSTNTGYLFQRPPSTRFPSLTLKPDSNIEALLKPTSPIQIFPLWYPCSIETHQISTSLRAHLGPE